MNPFSAACLDPADTGFGRLKRHVAEGEDEGGPAPSLAMKGTEL